MHTAHRNTLLACFTSAVDVSLARPLLHPAHRNTVTCASGLGLPSPTSSSGLGSSLPHLHQDWPRPVTCASGLGSPELGTEFSTAARLTIVIVICLMLEEILIKPVLQLRGWARALAWCVLLIPCDHYRLCSLAKDQAALQTYNRNHFGRQHAAYETRRAAQTDAESSHSLHAIGATCCGRTTACPVRGFRLRGQAPHVDSQPRAARAATGGCRDH